MNKLVEKYVGISYKHNGRKIEDGLDCLGVIICFLHECGYELPNDDGCAIEIDWYKNKPSRLIQGFEEYGKRIPIKQIQLLDVVVFSFHNVPRHLGIMVNDSYFLHAREGKKTSVMRLKRYMKYFYSAYRVVK